MNWPYNCRLVGTGLVILGAFFLGEHIYRWGFDPLDFIGHEWVGALLVVAGIVWGYFGYRLEKELNK